MRNLVRVGLISALVVVSQTAVLRADAGVDQAKQVVQSVGDKALKIISEKAGSKDQKQKKLESLFGANVDINWVSRFVAGRFWKTATADQQRKYSAAYKDFTLSRYSSRFVDYSGGGFTITNAQKDEEDNFKIAMKIESKEMSEPLLVEYRLHKADDGKLKIFDVMVEGVSMIATQRSEFASILNSEGIDSLTQKLASKNLTLNDGTAPKKTAKN